jgi:hypothetical protein
MEFLPSTLVLGIDVGKHNFALCLMNTQYNILAWDNLDIGNAFPFQIFCKNMIEKLDEFLLPFMQSTMKNTFIVAIENPPTFKNPMLKAVACAFIMYFTLRNEKHFELKWLNARYIHSKILHEKISKSVRYKERKQKAIDACFEYVQDPFWLQKLRQADKKDDLCDAYLVARVELDRSIRGNKGNLQLITDTLPYNVGALNLIDSFQEGEQM